jgi:5-formyltetrahydrofolate cyclo-ligase
MLFRSQIDDLLRNMPWVRARREQSELRAIAEQQRRLLTHEQVQEQSARIIAQIEQMTVFRDARTILLYYPIHNEVDLRPLLTKYAGQKTFLLPVTHRHSIEVRPYEGEDKMHKGRFGVPEPQTAAYKGTIDVLFVPGTVFDTKGHRIGRGGGYYDKFLSKHPQVPKIGVCYPFQLKKKDIPVTWRDRKVDQVVTPQATIG